VTLLPRHWEWLATQPGGASATLRRLIDRARKTGKATDNKRQRHDRAYHFMYEVAGDLPDYEASLRALFADDEAAFTASIESWPQDIRQYALRLAFGRTGLIKNLYKCKFLCNFIGESNFKLLI
jgi:hypothetical protein